MDKDHILNEIKRTAKENGGIPLGKQRFYNETGIKDADWLGKIWIRWSDVLIEAGFAANEMQGSLSDEYILEKYASFVKEINHIPTTPELRMRARQNDNFPAHTTFYKYGNKHKLLLQVIKYCEQRNEYFEILNLLKAETKIEVEAIEESNTESGYVYLLQFGEEYKIGSSNNVERRFREIKTQMPYEGKVVHSISTGDPAGIESYWHNYFRERRLKGEWFKLSKKDIAYFKKRKLM